MKPPQRGQVANWNPEGLGNLRASAWGSDDGWTVLNGGLDGGLGLCAPGIELGIGFDGSRMDCPRSRGNLCRIELV